MRRNNGIASNSASNSARRQRKHQMFKEAFGDNALGQTQTYEWFKRFKNGRISVNDERIFQILKNFINVWE
jgi:hypothetical protein